MKTFTKTASIVLALTIAQCACGICANAEEAKPDYATCKDGIHVTDTTSGDTTIDVKTAVASVLKDGIKSYQVAVNKVDSINSQYNAGKIYFLEDGTTVAAVRGLTGVSSTIGQGNSAAVVDQTESNGILTTKLPTTSLSPVVDTAVKTNDVIGISVNNTNEAIDKQPAQTVVGKVVIGNGTPDTIDVTATNKLGTVTSNTEVSDTAVVATATPKVAAAAIVASAKGFNLANPMGSAVALINGLRLTGTTDTSVSNSLTTTLGGSTLAKVTDVNSVTNSVDLANKLGLVSNNGSVTTTTTATPAIPTGLASIIDTVSNLGFKVPSVSTNVTASADVNTTTEAAKLSDDGESISASTTVSDTASVLVNNKLPLVTHSGSATITNTVTPTVSPATALAALTKALSTVKNVAAGKETVTDAIKAAATDAAPDTITVSGSNTRTIDVSFGSTGTSIVSTSTGSIGVSATNNTLGTASTSVATSSTTNVNVPSASTILNGLFGGTAE